MFHNLGSVTCPDRHVKAAKVMNILRCISPSETAMFEQHELSSVLSDLEDPFSDDDDHITATIKKKVISLYCPDKNFIFKKYHSIYI